MRKTVILITIQNRLFVKLQRSYINFRSSQDSFFSLFCFSLYIMAGSKYCSDNYKNFKISIGTIVKDPNITNSITV